RLGGGARVSERQVGNFREASYEPELDVKAWGFALSCVRRKDLVVGRRIGVLDFLCAPSCGPQVFVINIEAWCEPRVVWQRLGVVLGSVERERGESLLVDLPLELISLHDAHIARVVADLAAREILVVERLHLAR